MRSTSYSLIYKVIAAFLGWLMLVLVTGCSSTPNAPLAEEAEAPIEAPDYLIGPGDSVNIFVWRNPELSMSVPVRPDGKITTPLIEDVPAAGKTPTQLARDMEKELAVYVKNPVVTVIVTGFVGPYSQQVRVVGQATNPRAVPFREDMTLLDLIIEVGGLTEFADGNRAVVVRRFNGEMQQLRVRIDDLINDGDISANVRMMPGDVLIIPEAWF